MRHSLHPKKIDMQHDHARVSIGGPHCAREHVYSASLLNGERTSGVTIFILPRAHSFTSFGDDIIAGAIKRLLIRSVSLPLPQSRA